MPRREWLLLLALLPLARAVPAAAAPKPIPTVTVTVTQTVIRPAPSAAATAPGHAPSSQKPSGWLNRLDGRARPLAIEAVAVFTLVVIGYAYVVIGPSRRRGRKVDRATPPQTGALPAEREEKR